MIIRLKFCSCFKHSESSYHQNIFSLCLRWTSTAPRAPCFAWTPQPGAKWWPDLWAFCVCPPIGKICSTCASVTAVPLWKFPIIWWPTFRQRIKDAPRVLNGRLTRLPARFPSISRAIRWLIWERTTLITRAKWSCNIIKMIRRRWVMMTLN